MSIFPPSMPVPLEVAVFSPEDALMAQQLGARRVELNARGSYTQGGLTPALGDVSHLAQNLNIPLRIMVRPRGAPEDGSPDFIYSDEEFEAMKTAIVAFKSTGLLNPIRGDGFVFGILAHQDPDSHRLSVDIPRCRQLTTLARPIPCIFHRAFDPIAASSGRKTGLRALTYCGFDGVLTAGGRGTYADNVDILMRICRDAPEQLKIIIGGGVRAKGVAQTVQRLRMTNITGVWMHSSCMAAKPRPEAPEEVSPEELMDLVKQLGLDHVD